MPLEKFTLRPGIVKEGTDYSNEGGWFDANLVRFRKNFPEKIGGWTKNTTNTFLSTCRALHAWVDLQLTAYLGLGTTWKYYVKQGINYNDITPIRKTTTGGATFTSASGSSTITVTDSSHGAVVDDFVTFGSTATLGTSNITATILDQEYQVVSVPTANTYTFIAKDTDTGTADGHWEKGHLAQLVEYHLLVN